MSYFIPVLYKDKQYPKGIIPKIEEISGNFDVAGINPSMDYSLHTEYSFGARDFSNESLEELETLKNSHINKIPQLWFNKKWSEEFAVFIKQLTKGYDKPKTIEVHPPFKDYCQTMDKFVDTYRVFESYFPDTNIVIENREGTLCKSDFLVTKPKEIVDLSNAIMDNDLKLRIVLDLPQLLHSERPKEDFLNKNKEPQIKEQIKNALNQIRSCRECIDGLHVWGQDKNENGQVRSHLGDLNTFFTSSQLKKYFLDKVLETFSDGRTRYFVPEVNSSEKDLKSLVNDFCDAGFRFV